MSEQRETVWLTVHEYALVRKVSVRTVWRLIKADLVTVDRVSPKTPRIRLTRIKRATA